LPGNLAWTELPDYLIDSVGKSSLAESQQANVTSQLLTNPRREWPRILLCQLPKRAVYRDLGKPADETEGERHVG
jgi:hypothetical protein